MTDAVRKLIEDLATELAIAMEHYEPDEQKWFPEAIATLNRFELFTVANGSPVAEPVRFVLDRRRRVGGS